MNLGENIKLARKKANVSQKELCEKLNIPKSTFSGYENNYRKPPVDVLMEIAKALNIPLEELTGTTVTTYGISSNGKLIDTNNKELKTKVSIFNYNQQHGQKLELPYTKENYMLEIEKYFEDTFIIYAKHFDSNVLLRAISEIEDLSTLDTIIQTAKMQKKLLSDLDFE